MTLLSMKKALFAPPLSMMPCPYDQRHWGGMAQAAARPRNGEHTAACWSSVAGGYAQGGAGTGGRIGMERPGGTTGQTAHAEGDGSAEPARLRDVHRIA